MVIIQCWIDRKRPKLLHIHDIPAHLAAIVIFLYLRLVVHILFLILILPLKNVSIKIELDPTSRTYRKISSACYNPIASSRKIIFKIIIIKPCCFSIYPRQQLLS